MTGLKLFKVICCAVALFVFPQRGIAQMAMTYDEYKMKLTEQEQRLAELKKSLLECQTASNDLSNQISSLDTQISEIKQQVYGLVESDEAGVNEYMQELGRVESRLMGLRDLPEEALFEVRDEIDQIEVRISELKADKRSCFPAAQAKLASIDQLFEQVKSRMPRKRIRQYSVVRGDNLWRIAKKDDIYGDPYLWPRIYVENRDKIKHPDIIYPKWVLNIPFGVDLNQHLVMSGENLSSIAGKVYNDVTKWSRIYQANKTQIFDPSMIFPAQVFDIPAN
jgi:nucleoid-associated protein YgaU